jgi:hypothetical protein
MNNPNWEVEHDRFMTVAYDRTMMAAKRAFYGWHGPKQEDAIAECMAKLWDSWSRLLMRDRDPQPLLPGLIKYAVLWVKYDRRIAGRSRNVDIYDYRSGLSQQMISENGQAVPSDRSSAANPWINWGIKSGDNPCDLAAALESTGITVNQWCDY